MTVIVWIAEDGSGDLFFDGDEWAKGRTRDRVTFPMVGPIFMRTFVKTAVPVKLHTAEDFPIPMWSCHASPGGRRCTGLPRR